MRRIDTDDYAPVHIHVIKDGNEAKYNVYPAVQQVFNHVFKKHYIAKVRIESDMEQPPKHIREYGRLPH